MIENDSHQDDNNYRGNRRLQNDESLPDGMSLDSLHLEMGEVAALSPDEPRRRDLENRLANDLTSTDQEWRDLLLENECFRDNLPKVKVPDDLEARLLAVAIVPSRPRVTARWVLGLAAAAVVLLMLGSQLGRQYTTVSRMRTVALLAINNHLNHLEDHDVQVQTPEPQELELELTGQVGFRVKFPDLDDRLQLAGGRPCKLGTHPVAFTLWRDAHGTYSLFQFQPDRFGLVTTIDPTLVHTTQPAGVDHISGAWLWTEGQYGYVLTGDPGNDLRRLSLGSKKSEK